MHSNIFLVLEKISQDFCGRRRTLPSYVTCLQSPPKQYHTPRFSHHHDNHGLIKCFIYEYQKSVLQKPKCSLAETYHLWGVTNPPIYFPSQKSSPPSPTVWCCGKITPTEKQTFFPQKDHTYHTLKTNLNLNTGAMAMSFCWNKLIEQVWDVL